LPPEIQQAIDDVVNMSAVNISKQDFVEGGANITLPAQIDGLIDIVKDLKANPIFGFLFAGVDLDALALGETPSMLSFYVDMVSGIVTPLADDIKLTSALLDAYDALSEYVTSTNLSSLNSVGRRQRLHPGAVR
jgi:hypothetical protein